MWPPDTAPLGLQPWISGVSLGLFLNLSNRGVPTFLWPPLWALLTVSKWSRPQDWLAAQLEAPGGPISSEGLLHMCPSNSRGP